MSKKKTDGKGPATIAPLPWEKGAPVVPDAEETLFDILGSDPDFQDEEDADDADELESDQDSDDDDADEPDETDDDDDDDEDEDDLDDVDDEDIEEDEDDEDEDDDDDENRSDNDLHEVKVQGETVEVTLEELKSGYSRTEDYTRKRQADTAEQATAMAEIGGVRDKYISHLEQLQAVMESMTPVDGPDEALRDSDPGEYAAQKQDRADRLDAIAKVAAEKASEGAKVQKERDAAQAVYLQGEMKQLIEAVDGWDNDAVRATEIAELRTFATDTYGFTSEELDNVVDHRLLLLLRENQQSRAKVKKGKKEIRQKSKGAKKLKPGSGRGRRVKQTGKTRKRNQAARSKLAQTGSVNDAADAILGLLGDDD